MAIKTTTIVMVINDPNIVDNTILFATHFLGLNNNVSMYDLIPNRNKKDLNQVRTYLQVMNNKITKYDHNA